MAMFDEEEFRRDPRIPNTNINKDEDGNYQPYEPLDHSLMPYSLFVIAKIVLGAALVLCLPILIIDFSASIKGYLKLLGLFVVVMVVSRVFGLRYLD